MNRTLNEIDKTLSESKSKMKSDFERSLRGLNFGKLYLKNGEYETALKYVKNYLSVRPNSSEGHKLLAQIYEAIGEDETALFNYRKALDLKKNSNENYLSSIQSSMSTPSMSEIKKQIENNSNPSVESTPMTTPVRKERTPEVKENKYSHSCGTCSNQSLLNKMAKQNESLIETNKIILDILKQNNSNISDIQNKMVWITETLNNLTDSQNLMKDTLYDFMAQEENEGFDDYLLDDKENESLDTSALLGVNNSQSGQWHSSGLQLMPNTDQNRPLSELFKPAVDSWKCDACYVQNNGSDILCVACSSPKPGLAVEPTVPEPIKSNLGFGNAQPFSFKAPSSTSSGFTFGAIESNPSSETNTIFGNTNFKFGNPIVNPTFNSMTSPPHFDLQSSQPNENKSPQNIFSINPNSSDTKVSSFQFGLSRTFDFEFPKFGAQPPLNPSNTVTEESPQKNKDEENTSLNESVEPSNADNIYFQPVVPLPPKIEVKTGEEEEEVIHSVRAKLYRFVENEWKERGVGDIKILESRDSNRIRLLMRRETIFKVCLNQYITPDLKFDVKDDKKSITWSAIDYSEDTPVPQIFLLRLKNVENAQLFLYAVENAISNINTSSQSTDSSYSTKDNDSTNENKSIETSNESKVISSNEDDIEIVYQKMPESEDILKKVRELKLPINFYDYENMKPCPGCRGCDNNIPLFTNSEPKSLEKTTETPDSTEESLFHSLIAGANISQTDWNKNNSVQPLWQSSAPTPIFSSTRSPSQGDDDAVPPNPDIYFKPLIPLPDLIEVKTGEEEETPIYCQRAKLYRYDPQIKEWKERGVGDFKILKHNSKNRFRMILRRDQILKIACNHYISSSMELKPMNTSETAICWNTIDYTDGNPTEEQFALKFKNKDILQNFIKLFNDCKSGLDDANTSLNDSISFNGSHDNHQN